MVYPGPWTCYMCQQGKPQKEMNVICDDCFDDDLRITRTKVAGEIIKILEDEHAPKHSIQKIREKYLKEIS